MMKIKKSLLGLFILPALLGACHSVSDVNISPVGQNWLLEDIQGAGVIDLAQTTLSFEEDGRVNGNGACNRYFGEVDLAEANVTFGPMGSTKMLCPEAIMKQEDRFFKALGNVSSFNADQNYLLLMDREGKQLLKFTKIID